MFFIPFNHTMRKLLLVNICFAACTGLLTAQPKKVIYDINNLAVTWQVVENNYAGKVQSLSALNFSNNGKQVFPASGWKIYFNYARLITPQTVTGNVVIDHINGDLFCMSPLENFQPVRSKQQFRVDFLSSDWVVNYTDAPAGMYIVWNDASEGEPIGNFSVIPSTEDKQIRRSPGDKIGLITPGDIYNLNAGITDIPAGQLTKIFPTPLSYKETGGVFKLSAATGIVADKQFENEARYLADQMQNLLGKRTTTAFSMDKDVIRLQQKEMPRGAYELKINNKIIGISAGSAEGMFYGIQSLLSLMPPGSWKGIQKNIPIPAVEVADAPRFGYRGEGACWHH